MNELSPEEPFFRRSIPTRAAVGDEPFLPTAACRGPWDANSLHGRVVAGLLAHAIEQQHGTPDFMPARFTIDMYRLPDFSPVTLTTRLVRDGYRIKVIDAEFFSAGKSMARATALLLRRTENPPGRVWSAPDWDVPKPDDVPATDMGAMSGMWSHRPISGAFGTYGQKRVWISEVRCLVDEQPLSPWVRAALVADIASPYANSGDEGLGYINTDITLYLHREPQTKWIGVEATNHHAADGVAVGEVRLYDEIGAIGTSTVAALAQGRRAMTAPTR